MFKHSLQILSFTTLYVLLQSCAQIEPLTGGQRDTTAPKLVIASPKNLETNFRSSVIILKFDEYIQLKDITNQLVISPKLKTQPDIEWEGKKVKIVLDTAELKPNTTYRFYFGQAIVDMNESNPLKNFEYIFSTGNFIDSLEVKGLVKNASNNKAYENALIGIYTTSLQNDSLPYKETADYITLSDAEGKFSIKHLPRKQFKAYAIGDLNKNLVYDRDVEKVGFLDEILDLKKDSLIHLNLFKEEANKVFIKKTMSPYYGHSKIILNKKQRVKLTSLPPYSMGDIYLEAPEALKDTLNIYYKNISDSLKVELNYPSKPKSDTVQLNLAKKTFRNKRFGFISTNAISGKVPLGLSTELHFINWMDTSKTNFTKMRLLSRSDSLTDTMVVNGHWLSVRKFQLHHSPQPGKKYTMVIDTAAFTDMHSMINDSAKLDFSYQSKSELGKVSLKMVFQRKQHYVVQLITENELVAKEEEVSLSLSSSNAKTIVFTDVQPGNYRAKIIFDSNQNGKWDSGDLFLKQQPEAVILDSKQLKVIADWEIEEEILLKD